MSARCCTFSSSPFPVFLLFSSLFSFFSFFSYAFFFVVLFATVFRLDLNPKS